MLDILENGIGYVKMTYPDNSVRLFRSTLNVSILLQYGAVVEEGCLFDIDRQEQVPYDLDFKWEISKERPELEEVDEFANRFI